MKKATMIIGMMAVMAIVSCKKKEETTITTTPVAEPTTEVAPPATEEEQDGTSISVGTDGVDISTKNGAKETNVKVENGDAKVEVKK
ncbi:MULTISPECIES: hypothetical protein [unclassified Flavobacterium]|uniref:hypothetical protein n=1 Tax=unclassified Flavobacterium TaxID=196869 RepID=UPI003F9380E6